MKLEYEGLVVRNPQIPDSWVRVDVYGNRRSGTKSPYSFCYKYAGRFIAAFERRIRGWDDPTPMQWMKIIYSGAELKSLTYIRNPFLKMIPKDIDAFAGRYIPVPNEFKARG